MPPMPETQATRPTPDSRAGRTARVVFWIAVYLTGFYIFLKAYELSSGGPSAKALNIDFLVFWAAAKMALAGEALAAFDLGKMAATAGIPPEQESNLLWLYPPGFLMLLAPLGALPLWAAWTVFFAGSAACLALAVRIPAAALPGGWRLVAVAPAVSLGALNVGQNSVLWTAALVAALWAMRQRQAVWAGLWIALLTMKPQLGLLIPVALIAGREWRVLAWTTGWSAVLLLVSTAAFGPAYWEHFLSGLGDAARQVEQGVMPVHKMVSAYAFARALDAGHQTALGWQFAATAAIAAAVAWVWSRPAVGHDMKCAALCAAIPLATPYAFYYEATLTLAAAMFLVRDGFGRGWPARLWLALIWIGPVLPNNLQSAASMAASMPPFLAATAVICLIRAWRQDRAHRPAA